MEDLFGSLSYARWIPQSAGLPVQAQEELNAAMDAKFKANLLAKDEIARTIGQLELEDENRGYVDEWTNKVKEQLKDYENNNSWERAGLAVQRIATEMTTDQNLKAARASYAAKAKYEKELDEKVAKGEYEPEDAAMGKYISQFGRTNARTGVDKGNIVNSFKGVIPVADPDIVGEMLKVAKNMNANVYEQVLRATKSGTTASTGRNAGIAGYTTSERVKELMGDSEDYRKLMAAVESNPKVRARLNFETQYQLASRFAATTPEGKFIYTEKGSPVYDQDKMAEEATRLSNVQLIKTANSLMPSIIKEGKITGEEAIQKEALKQANNKLGLSIDKPILSDFLNKDNTVNYSKVKSAFTDDYQNTRLATAGMAAQDIVKYKESEYDFVKDWLLEQSREHGFKLAQETRNSTIAPFVKTKTNGLSASIMDMYNRYENNEIKKNAIIANVDKVINETTSISPKDKKELQNGIRAYMNSGLFTTDQVLTEINKIKTGNAIEDSKVRNALTEAVTKKNIMDADLVKLDAVLQEAGITKEQLRLADANFKLKGDKRALVAIGNKIEGTVIAMEGDHDSYQVATPAVITATEPSAVVRQSNQLKANNLVLFNNAKYFGGFVDSETGAPIADNVTVELIPNTFPSTIDPSLDENTGMFQVRPVFAVKYTTKDSDGKIVKEENGFAYYKNPRPVDGNDFTGIFGDGTDDNRINMYILGLKNTVINNQQLGTKAVNMPSDNGVTVGNGMKLIYTKAGSGKYGLYHESNPNAEIQWKEDSEITKELIRVLKGSEINEIKK